MEGIGTKVLLILGALFLFAVVVIGLIQPAIETKGTEIKTKIEAVQTSK